MKRFRWLGLLVAVLGVAGACERPRYSYSDDLSVAGTSSSFGGVTGVAGTPARGGSAAADECRLQGVASQLPIFKPQTISNQLPATGELYLQLTDAEAAALEQGGPLIVPPPAGAPAPALSRVLEQLTGLVTSEDRKALVEELKRRFKVTRATWPNPWALRLIAHAGTEHMNAVRLRLKPDAWIARVLDNSPIVVDLDNSPVALKQALAQPERIAAVYYLANDKLGNVGTSAPCESGKREFALGNEAMVESFELRTEDIQARAQSDLDALRQLFSVARKCVKFDAGDGMTFHASTTCQAWDFFDTTTEYLAYQWSLSDPAELYKPTPTNLANLIQALEDDAFELDPFVSEPHPVALPDGGAGGAAGEAGAAQGGAGLAGDSGFPQGGL